MEIKDEFYLETEGWGICHTGKFLVQSNGTSTLRFRNTNNFTIQDSISVTLNGQPQMYLNELEYINGQILANQWRTNRILFINPVDGCVERIINLGSILPVSGGVLNGIASGADGTIYCTGKNWPVTLIIEDI